MKNVILVGQDFLKSLFCNLQTFESDFLCSISLTKSSSQISKRIQTYNIQLNFVLLKFQTVRTKTFLLLSYFFSSSHQFTFSAIHVQCGLTLPNMPLSVASQRSEPLYWRPVHLCYLILPYCICKTLIREYIFICNYFFAQIFCHYKKNSRLINTSLIFL
jgi:hypothetical protein